ncbi:F-type ATPase subunit b [Marinibacterium anthonyi]|nr:F-type ATPase subunit b [Marinibacterium anthonyi]
MTIDWWTIGLQTVNAAILIWLLARFLFRPVTRMIADRQAATDAAFDQAEAARAEARAARDEAAAARESLAAERNSLMAQAREEAEREKKRLAEETRAELETLRQRQAAELDRERSRLERGLTDDAGVLATEIAARLLDRLLDRLPEAGRIAGFIDGLAQAVADLPEATRTGIGRDGPVTIRAARAVADDDRATIERRLGDVLGHSVSVRIETDATLIAGLELTTDHALARNTLRADLDRIKAELTTHD